MVQIKICFREILTFIAIGKITGAWRHQYGNVITSFYYGLVKCTRSGVTMEPKTFYCQIINFKSINQALDKKSVIILKMLRECHQLLPVTVFSIENGRNLWHSCNLSRVLADSLSRALLKVSLFRKNFLVSSNSSKKQMNKFVHSTVRQKNRIRSFVFWKNPRVPKVVSKLSDL